MKPEHQRRLFTRTHPAAFAMINESEEVRGSHFNSYLSTATILDSTLTGFTHSIYNLRGEGVGAEAKIANTTLDGAASGNSGLECAAVRDENFAPLDDSCRSEGN